MTARFDLALFDLDGTLTNSGPGVIDCVTRTLVSMGRPVPPMSTLRRFIGPPLFQSFTQFCGFSAADADEAIRRFRKLYDNGGIFNNSVYDGIPEALTALHTAGMRLAVATSKPEPMAKVVLSHYDLARYFDDVSAADESERGGGKEELILPVLKRVGCEPARAVMIGDTKFDAAGARNAGTGFLGVLYGFGTEEEMRREGAQHFAHTPAEIAHLLVDKPEAVR
jgi:phosphoglycolate phosphatase